MPDRMIDILDIKVTKTEESGLAHVDFDNLLFGSVHSDHMFMADYEDGEWKNSRIIPFRDLRISPANATLHYAQSIFEGLKAHRNEHGDILLFRADANAGRMIKSADRMCMPAIPKEMFLKAIEKLVKIDREWVPDRAGTSLYIRPFQFATDSFIGIRPSGSYTFSVITGPVGEYYSGPVRVKIEQHFTRASKGGVGAVKTSGNYAASLYPAKIAQEQGYHQLIWTDGISHEFIEESGTMNIMFVINDVLVTPPTSDSILSGITRDSALILARDWGIQVEERPITVTEIMKAIQDGSLSEAFGIGTAATISQIQTLGYEGTDYDLSPIENRTISNRLSDELTKIKLGEVEDKFGWIRKVV